MKNNELVKKITGNAILIAVTVVLTFISNNISIAGISINLALIPIALAAILYGKVSGMIVGAANGCIVMFSAAGFFAINPVATVFVCLLKSMMAGLISAILFKLIHQMTVNKTNKPDLLASVVATVIVPIINTCIFIVGVLLFFEELLASLVTMFLLVNFLLELTISALLSPSIYYIINIYKKRHNTL